MKQVGGKKPLERWAKLEHFPVSRALLHRGFYLTHSPVEGDRSLNFTNCSPSHFRHYANMNVDKDSPIALRRAELNRWSLFKAGTNLYTLPYTTMPLRIERNGGRGHTGVQWIRHIGGGDSRMFFWIDKWRMHPEDPDMVQEEVIELFNHSDQSAKFALVAGGMRKRYVSATSEMAPGDIITSSRKDPPVSYKFKSGDCFPLSAFEIGTKICNFEKSPQSGAVIATSAGCSGTLTRKYIDEESKIPKALIEMPSKNSFVLDQTCLAVFGVSSNIEHNQTKYSNFPQNMRDTDKRSRSGFWTWKGGRFGRKNHPKRTYQEFREGDGFNYQTVNIFDLYKTSNSS